MSVQHESYKLVVCDQKKLDEKIDRSLVAVDRQVQHVAASVDELAYGMAPAAPVAAPDQAKETYAAAAAKKRPVRQSRPVSGSESTAEALAAYARQCERELFGTRTREKFVPVYVTNIKRLRYKELRRLFKGFGIPPRSLKELCYLGVSRILEIWTWESLRDELVLKLTEHKCQVRTDLSPDDPSFFTSKRWVNISDAEKKLRADRAFEHRLKKMKETAVLPSIRGFFKRILDDRERHLERSEAAARKAELANGSDQFVVSTPPTITMGDYSVQSMTADDITDVIGEFSQDGAVSGTQASCSDVPEAPCADSTACMLTATQEMTDSTKSAAVPVAVQLADVAEVAMQQAFTGPTVTSSGASHFTPSHPSFAIGSDSEIRPIRRARVRRSCSPVTKKAKSAPRSQSRQSTMKEFMRPQSRSTSETEGSAAQ